MALTPEVIDQLVAAGRMSQQTADALKRMQGAVVPSTPPMAAPVPAQPMPAFSPPAAQAAPVAPTAPAQAPVTVSVGNPVAAQPPPDKYDEIIQRALSHIEANRKRYEGARG